MKIICFGDSNTFGYDPRSMFGEPYEQGRCWVDILKDLTGHQVVNNGLNGRDIPAESYDFPNDTDLLIIMLGTNDLLQFWTPGDAAGKMQRFIQSLSIQKSRILLIAPPTMRLGAWVEDQELIDDSIRLAREYEVLSKQLDIRFVDAARWNVELAYDGVHFTEKGHTAFAQGLYRFLMDSDMLG